MAIFVILVGSLFGITFFTVKLLHSVSIPMRNHSIGAGVKISGNKVPLIIKATALDLTERPIEESEALSPAIRITPDGALPSSVELQFLLSDTVERDYEVIAATRDDDSKDWNFITPRISADGKTATVTTDHLSIWQIFRIFTLAPHPEQKFKDVVKRSLTGELLEKAQKPTCPEESKARTDGYTITSSTGGALYWCFGMENGKRMVKVVNRKKYPLDILHPGLEVAKKQQVTLEFSQLARLGTKERTILFPREEITYELTFNDTDTSAGIISGFGPSSIEAVKLAGIEAAIDAYFSIIPKLNAKEVLTYKDKYEMINKALSAKACINNVASKDMTGLLADCITPEVLEQIAPRSLVLPAIKSTVSVGNWFAGFVTSTADSFNHDAEYQILINRKVSNSKSDKLIDPATTDITGNRVNTRSGMPCPEPSGGEGQLNIGYWMLCGASLFDMK